MPKNANIPGTNPDWNLELPDGDLNSLVAKDGQPWDNGYNFDEKDDEAEETPAEDTPSFDPEAAKKAREEAIKEQE